MNKCIKCEKEVEHLEFDTFDNGVEFKEQAGYGSKHDGEDFIIYVCDDCLELYKNSI